MDRSKTLQMKSSVDSKRAIETILAILLMFAVAKFVGDNFFKFYINTDHSLPQKLFLVNKKDKVPEKGEYIVFSFKGSEYYREGHKMIKRVECMPGEILKVEGKKYFCNGVYLGTARATDSKGKPVSNFKWNGKIPDGKYFVMGTSKDSYDSRYWGFVDNSRIVGVAHPVF